MQQQKKRQRQTWTTIDWQDSQAVRRLLENGRDPNERLSGNQTPLHRAVLRSSEAVRLLLDAGADLYLRDDYQRTPLQLAALLNSVEPARIILRRNPHLANDTLRLAAYSWSNDMILLSLEYEADVNHHFLESQETTPLHISIGGYGGGVETIRLLLGRGANIEAGDVRNHRPLHYAVTQQNTDILRELLDRGADPNAQSNTDRTPLHEAAIHNNRDNIRLLLERGANPDARSDTGRTPLHEAVIHSKPDNIRLLLERGADPDAQDDTGRTPLHEATTSPDPEESIRLLLESGADPYLRDQDGHTAFRKAIGKNNIQRIFLEHGYIPLPGEYLYIPLPGEYFGTPADANARIREIRQAQQRFRMLIRQSEQLQQGQQKQEHTVARDIGTMTPDLFGQLMSYTAPSIPRRQERNRFREWCQKHMLDIQHAAPQRRARWLEQMRYEQKRSSRKG
ncbi:hypothetical protein EBZ80_12620 [bacterium]|nr:hypothetical protein [bacterium]